MRDLDYRDIPRLPTWKQEEIERKVVDLLVEHNIHTIPIDPTQIIKSKGYILVPFSNIEESDLPEDSYQLNDAFTFYDKQKKTYVIVYNDQQIPARNRFTLMHEIAHIELGHKGESDLAKKMADYYAGYALAPVPILARCRYSSPEKAAKIFNISKSCAEVCCDNCDKWQRNGNSLKDYEKKLLKQFHM